MLETWLNQSTIEHQQEKKEKLCKTVILVNMTLNNEWEFSYWSLICQPVGMLPSNIYASQQSVLLSENLWFSKTISIRFAAHVKYVWHYMYFRPHLYLLKTRQLWVNELWLFWHVQGKVKVNYTAQMISKPYFPLHLKIVWLYVR